MSRRDNAIFWLIFALGAALRLGPGLYQALWYDEANSLWWASLPFTRMVAATAGDVHPPLYYTVLWVWLRVAGAAGLAATWIARLPSVAFSLWAVWLACRLAGALRLRPDAILTGSALTALLPFQIYFAQEARMYAMLQSLFLLAVLAAIKRRWWLLGLANLAMLYTHNYGAFYALVASLVAFWAVFSAHRPHRSGNLRGLLNQIAPDVAGLSVVSLLAVAAWLPWAWVIVQQVSAHFGGYGYWLQDVTPGRWLFPFYMLWWVFTFPDTLQIHAALVVIGLLIFGVVKAGASRSQAPILLAGLTLSVPLLAGLASEAWRPVLLWRALIGVAVPFYLLAAWALTHRVGLRGRQFALVILAPLVLFGQVGQASGTGELKGDPLPHIATVREGWQAGDVVVHGNSGTVSLWHPYAPEWSRFLLSEPGPIMGALSPATEAAMGMHYFDLEDVNEWQRVWFVWAITATTSLEHEARGRAMIAQYNGQLVEVMARDKAGEVLAGIWLLERTP